MVQPNTHTFILLYSLTHTFSSAVAQPDGFIQLKLVVKKDRSLKLHEFYADRTLLKKNIFPWSLCEDQTHCVNKPFLTGHVVWYISFFTFCVITK